MGHRLCKGLALVVLLAAGACSSPAKPTAPAADDTQDPMGGAGAGGAPDARRAEPDTRAPGPGDVDAAVVARDAGSVAGDVGAVGGGSDGGSASEVAAGPGWAGIAGIEDLSMVSPSAGCGKDPGQELGTFVRYTVTITPKPVRGTGNREYFIRLPSNYDKNKPYRLIFEGPGCSSGNGSKVIDYFTPAGTEGVIQVGLTPEFSCFDDQRTDSIEFQFLETVHALMKNKVCFDQHRAFVSGFSSGAWLSNMLGCVYGSKLIRAIAPGAGGLATKPGIAPPCTNLPTPGIWNHNEDDGTNSPNGTVAAINRALKVNKCQGDFATSARAPYQVASSAAASMVCEKFTSCPKEFPIVWCHPKTGAHSLPSFFPTAAWQFFSAF